MSWGYRIAILYLGFVTIILSLVFTCIGQTIELESKDYYARELSFQEQINATANLNGLNEPLEHLVDGKTVSLKIPGELLNPDFAASAVFFRPSDSSLDVTVPFVPDSQGNCVLQDQKLKSGMYKLRINIVTKGRSYFKEAVINLR